MNAGRSRARRVLDAVGRPGTEFPWQLVLENTIVGVSYMQDRRFLWANARMAEIFGYQAGELDGEPVRRLYATQEDYEDVGRLMSAATHDGFVTHERAMACKDGSLIWCRISGRLLQRGDIHSPSVWVVQDLSDKKRAEDALRRMNQRLEQTVERRTTNLRRSNEALHAQVEHGRALQAAVAASREKYRTLFRHMPLGVLVVDAAGGISEINRTLQSYLGATTRVRMDELLHDESRTLTSDGRTVSLAALVREHAAAAGPRRVERFEFRWVRPGGRPREIAAIGAPLVASGQGAVFTFADVTEQHRRREQEHEQQAALAHASRLSLMGQMASALAHELGQPLNASLSYVTGLRHRLEVELANRPELLAALDKATDHLEQAGQIIRNVRGFVSRQQPDFEVVELPALLEQTLALLDFPVRASGVRIDVHADAADGVPLAVRVNRVEMQQVMVNLLVNAIEAMQQTPAPQRRIVVRIHREPRGMVGVEVSDSGPGVSPELVSTIFEPYVTTKRTGLGMGLMISRTIVESHGGALRHVRQRGGGATFRFSLPAWSAS
jgi:PAS domain S-box-containing protein